VLAEHAEVGHRGAGERECYAEGGHRLSESVSVGGGLNLPLPDLAADGPRLL